MITMQCTYPDGETSEARLDLTLDYAFVLYDYSDWGAPLISIAHVIAFADKHAAIDYLAGLYPVDNAYDSAGWGGEA